MFDEHAHNQVERLRQQGPHIAVAVAQSAEGLGLHAAVAPEAEHRLDERELRALKVENQRLQTELHKYYTTSKGPIAETADL